MVEVRYCSRGGNTKKLALAIAEEKNVKALPVSDAKTEDVIDLLFIGGALYAYGIDQELKLYLDSLDKSKVKKAVVFSTSWISKHAIKLIKNALVSKGIEVAQEFIYARGNPNEKELANAKAIAKKYN